MKKRNFLILVPSIVAVISVGIAIIRTHLHSEYCSEKTYALPNGDISAVVSEEMCDGFGASDVVSVYLEKKIWGGFKRKSLVFKYDPSEFSSPLKVSWARERVLRINVDRVQFIENQSTGSYGVSVVYQIGAIGNPGVNN